MHKRLASFVASSYVAVAAVGCVPGVDQKEELPTQPKSPLPASLQQVVTSERPPVPLTGGTLRMMRDGLTAVASDPDRDVIWVTDIGRREMKGQVALNPGDEPGRLIEDGMGRMHVALRRGGAVVSLAVGGSVELLARRNVCPAPRGIAYDASTDRLHVACAGGELVTLAADPQVTEPVRTLRLDRDLRDVVVRGHLLFVSRFRSAEVLVVNAGGDVIARHGTPAAMRRRFVPSKGSSATEEKQVSFTANVAWRMVATPAGEMLMVHQAGSTEEVSVAPGGYGGGGGGECGDGIVESALSQVGAGGVTRGPTLMGSSLPIDLAVRDDGKQIAVLSAGQNHRTGRFPTVSTFSSRSSAGAPIGSTVAVMGPDVLQVPCTGFGGLSTPPKPPVTDGGAAGDSGDGLPPAPIEFRLPEGEAIAIAFGRRGHVVVQTREPPSIQVITANVRIPLPGASRADTGHGIFHLAVGNNSLSCATCHPEGGEDGRVWAFRKVGARRTQSLRGGIMDTAPFHWNGDLKDLSHLMSEVFESRMSGPSLEPAHTNVLARWMDTIPTLPNGPAIDAAAVERGRAVYNGPIAACATCHGGNELTNNSTVNVGTGRALQVPTMRGIAHRAPFMHTGCAGTLAERLTSPACGGGDKHGVVSRLSPQERADLVTYLETL